MRRHWSASKTSYTGLRNLQVTDIPTKRFLIYQQWTLALV
jgi:hypothetical protein